MPAAPTPPPPSLTDLFVMLQAFCRSWPGHRPARVRIELDDGSVILLPVPRVLAPLAPTDRVP